MNDLSNARLPNETFEEYKRLCGEIKGLLTARGYIIDLKQNLEESDE